MNTFVYNRPGARQSPRRLTSVRAHPYRVPDLVDGQSTEHHRWRGPRPLTQHAIQGGQALVIEDRPEIGKRLVQLLEGIGFEVLVCTKDAALANLYQLNNGLVLCSDSGLEILTQIRSDPGFDALPFVVHSGSRDPGHISDMLNRGATDYVALGGDDAELIARVVASWRRSERLRAIDAGVVVDPAMFEYQLERELRRGPNRGRGTVAVLEVPGMSAADAVPFERREVLSSYAEYLAAEAGPLDLIGSTRYGDLAILLPQTTVEEARSRLTAMTLVVAGLEMQLGSDLVDMAPDVGYIQLSDVGSSRASVALTRAAVACAEAALDDDRRPKRYVRAVSDFVGPERVQHPTSSAHPTDEEGFGEHVLLVVDDPDDALLLPAALDAFGLKVTTTDGEGAARALGWSRYDAIIVDPDLPGMTGGELLDRVRSDPRFDHTPVIYLNHSYDAEGIAVALESGADDCLAEPDSLPELIARVRGRIGVGRLARRQEDESMVLPERFEFELHRELARVAAGGQGGAVAIVEVPSLETVGAGLGPQRRREVLEEIASEMQTAGGPLDVFGATRAGDLAILLPEVTAKGAGEALTLMGESVAGLTTMVAGVKIRPVPMIGFFHFDSGEETDPDTALVRASIASTEAASTQDLQPRLYVAREEITPKSRNDHHLFKELLQVLMTSVLGLVLPFGVYAGLDGLGWDITGGVYIAVVVALVTTGALIWTEGFLSGRQSGPPERPGSPPPPASAIICAYLPNEAPTIVETIEAFLGVEYEPGLQIILAYNTPEPMPVEAELRELEANHPHLLVLLVPHSNSKAQNLNFALARAVGEFVGVFDADHHPDPDSFDRAWRWLSNGYDAVQGHCLVRNGDDSFIARMVAVEFEGIYGVSHPGRWLRDGFGIFGGSNGYWLTDQLHVVRMRGSMLTEDIDSSMRLLERGGRIASDPSLISRELATTTPRQVWNQRLRWAQGWFQVSIRHVFKMLRSERFSIRQKIGIFNLLLQREVYPWVSVQIFPLVAFWMWRGDAFDWFVPLFVVTTLFTTSVGPGQVIFAYRRAHPDIKLRRWWFVQYFFFSILLYTEAKNVIGRVAQIKQVMGESSWRVTPRSVHPGS